MNKVDVVPQVAVWPATGTLVDDALSTLFERAQCLLDEQTTAANNKAMSSYLNEVTLDQYYTDRKEADRRYMKVCRQLDSLRAALRVG